ncbi:hypothetical protein [Nesterenkonia suensis]
MSTTDAPTLDELDAVTIDLIFILRDSLTELSALDFWSGRAVSAIQTAAAEADDPGHAISRAAEKLQIDSLPGSVAEKVRDISTTIRRDYQAWADHVDRNLIQVVALASAERDQRRRGTKHTHQTETATNEEIQF